MDNALRELIVNTAIGHAIRTDQLYNGLKALNKRGCIWADGEIIRGLGMLGSYGVRDKHAIDSLLHVSQTLSYESVRSYLASYQMQYREFYAVQKVGHLHAFVLFTMIDQREAGESNAT
ncbi:hypothetical protein [Bacillus altitudinis]|uniref:hypothetical protein n=1 Tax=Bacillus altitudinis TaxID=293387 RepID=UPI0011B4E19A|nr:hypothetical protein [Bacillus altitudinis]QDZ94835.1 hypothetical protein D0438_07765 [Bacillus altitudinis]